MTSHHIVINIVIGNIFILWGGAGWPPPTIRGAAPPPKKNCIHKYIYTYININRYSILVPFVEHRLGVMPSLFTLCIAHWFISLSTLARYDESGLNFSFENFYFSLLSGSDSLLCAALMSPQRTKQYCPQIEYKILYIYTSCMHSIESSVYACVFLTSPT